MVIKMDTPKEKVTLMKKYLVFPCDFQDKEYKDIYRLNPNVNEFWYFKTDDSNDGFRVETVEKFPKNFLFFAKLKQAKEYWKQKDYENRNSLTEFGQNAFPEPLSFVCPSCGMKHETDCLKRGGDCDNYIEDYATVIITCYCDKKFKVTPTITLTMKELMVES